MPETWKPQIIREQHERELVVNSLKKTKRRKVWKDRRMGHLHGKEVEEEGSEDEKRG